jgi:hypothetical protein
MDQAKMVYFFQIIISKSWMVSIYDMLAINKYRSIEKDLMNFLLAASDIIAARINVLMFCKN